MSEQRSGDWMATYTGQKFWPLDPRPEGLRIVDIAHALALTCRYNGHTNRFYSGAEHCILLCQQARKEEMGKHVELSALLHDAAEAYLSDLVSPLKNAVVGYQGAEYVLEGVIQDKYRLMYRGSEHPWVKAADRSILFDEAKALFTKPPDDWHLKYAPGLGVELLDLLPMEAEQLFLELAWDYLGERVFHD